MAPECIEERRILAGTSFDAIETFPGRLDDEPDEVEATQRQDEPMLPAPTPAVVTNKRPRPEPNAEDENISAIIVAATGDKLSQPAIRKLQPVIRNFEKCSQNDHP